MKRFVEGADRGQRTLFPECLEDWISESDDLVRSGPGPRTLFAELIAHLGEAGESARMCDIRDKWRRAGAGTGQVA
jgi:hypothetical protein